jgi:hypothetical protein
VAANVFIDSRGSGTHLSAAERREVTTEVLPSMQRLKTTMLLGGSCLSVIHRSGMLDRADSWAGVGLRSSGLRPGKCFPYFFSSDSFLLFTCFLF